MTLPPYVRAHGQGTLLAVKVQPRSSRTEVVGLFGGELKIKVAAPPVDSAANEALVEFLAKTLGCPRRSVAIVRGSAQPVVESNGDFVHDCECGPCTT